MTQQDDYVNDISGIVDHESFLNFIRIAFDTNPLEMCLGAILIIVVSIYINIKTSRLMKEPVRKYVEKLLEKRM
jgi:hypothetical protein